MRDLPRPTSYREKFNPTNLLLSRICGETSPTEGIKSPSNLRELVILATPLETTNFSIDKIIITISIPYRYGSNTLDVLWGIDYEKKLCCLLTKQWVQVFKSMPTKGNTFFFVRMPRTFSHNCTSHLCATQSINYQLNSPLQRTTWHE